MCFGLKPKRICKLGGKSNANIMARKMRVRGRCTGALEVCQRVGGSVTSVILKVSVALTRIIVCP